MLKLAKFVGMGLLIIGKFTLLPIILFIYKNILRIKIKTRYFNIKDLNYLIFIKKYLPSIVIVVIIITVTTNNIFAQNYSSDEYANRTLLPTLLPANEEAG
ncbi:hypothetical protein K8R42_01770, partial [bacterium]|nr:hypothetical protein [bacterium]